MGIASTILRGLFRIRTGNLYMWHAPACAVMVSGRRDEKNGAPGKEGRQRQQPRGRRSLLALPLPPPLHPLLPSRCAHTCSFSATLPARAVPASSASTAAAASTTMLCCRRSSSTNPGTVTSSSSSTGLWSEALICTDIEGEGCEGCKGVGGGLVLACMCVEGGSRGGGGGASGAMSSWFLSFLTPASLPQRQHRCHKGSIVATKAASLPQRQHRCRKGSTVATKAASLPQRQHRCRKGSIVDAKAASLPQRQHRCHKGSIVATKAAPAPPSRVNMCARNMRRGNKQRKRPHTPDAHSIRPCTWPPGT
eukprot:366204-Chlamydomonas_euryale.AAC.6